jgi:phage terminase large subunit
MLNLNPALKDFWTARGYRNRVLYGGRASSKTHDAGGFLTWAAANYRMRVMCTRHFQNRIDQSVYPLIADKAAALGIQDQFKFLDSTITHRRTGAEFFFFGRARNIEDIKGTENVDIHWAEEAQALTPKMWQDIDATVRKEHSQHLIIFNPQNSTDFVYERFVLNPPPKTLVRKINYDENPFLSQTMLDVIEGAKKEDYEEFAHIYLGVPRTGTANALILPQWVEAAIDAHKVLGFEPMGETLGALDVADEGDDSNALSIRHGVVLMSVDEWSGRGLDLYKTAEMAIKICLDHGAGRMLFDADGLGAAIRGDARVITDKMGAKLDAVPFRGSGELYDPKGIVPGLSKIEGADKLARRNNDYFKNHKAQAWHSLKLRFERTYRAVAFGEQYDPADMISISSDIKHLNKIKAELSQPVMSANGAGQMVVDKAPKGFKSPNLADSVMMCYNPPKNKKTFFTV